MEIRKIEKQDYTAAVEMLKSFYASDAVDHNIPEETIRHNAKRFRLEVEEDNIPAVNAYKKQGFEYLEYKQMVINK